MGVYFCCLQRIVSQKRLDISQISPTIQQVGSEAVPKHMNELRMDAWRVNRVGFVSSLASRWLSVGSRGLAKMLTKREGH